MPVGPYKTFDACVAAQKRKGHSDESARKICGAIEQKMQQGKSAEEAEAEAETVEKTAAWLDEYMHGESKKMTRKSINNLPDSDFAYIEPGGKKDEEGKTVPRSLRHFPIHDAAHVRNALARLPQSNLSAEAKKKALTKIKKAAKKFGIEVSE